MTCVATLREYISQMFNHALCFSLYLPSIFSVFSTSLIDGLIQEYWQTCHSIANGH